jgi:hypothetical protein
MHRSPPERFSRAAVVHTNYDIVKAPGGDLIVETKEGTVIVFTIDLPAV